MNKMHTMVMGVAAVISFASLALVPANADSSESAAPAPIQLAAALNPAETPQHLVWDMTYGDQAPAEAPASDAYAAENSEVSDLSMG